MLDKSSLLNLISLKIKQYKENQQKPGWTLWLLLSSGITIIWMLLDKLNAVSYSSKLLWVNIVIIYLTAEILKKIYSLIKPQRNGINYGFINMGRLLNDTRNVIFFHLLILLLALVLNNSINSVEGYQRIVLNFYLISQLFIELVVLYLSDKDFHINIGVGFKRFNPNLLQVSGIIILIVILIIFRNANSKNINASLLQVSILIYLLISIIEAIVGLESNNTYLNLMEDIEEKLIKDEITIENANKEIDIILKGMNIKGLMEKDIRELMGIISQVARKVELGRQYINECEELFNNKAGLNKEVMEKIDYARIYLTPEEEIIKKYEILSKQIRHKLTLYSFQVSEKNEITEIIEEINQEKIKQINIMRETRKKIEELGEKIREHKNWECK